MKAFNVNVKRWIIHSWKILYCVLIKFHQGLDNVNRQFIVKFWFQNLNIFKHNIYIKFIIVLPCNFFFLEIRWLRNIFSSRFALVFHSFYHAFNKRWWIFDLKYLNLVFLLLIFPCKYYSIVIFFFPFNVMEKL